MKHPTPPRRPQISDASADLRRRAELRLRGHPAKASPNQLNADNLRQLHELEIHQIELELQNAELQKARNDLDVTLEKYTDLYDFAPAGYFSLDESGLILEANLTSAASLGIERSRLINSRLSLFMSPVSRPIFQDFLKKVFSEPKNQDCEAQFKKEGGATFWASIRARSAVFAKGARKWCRVAFEDISERKAAEIALRESEKRFRILFEMFPAAVYSCDAAGVIQNFNRRATELWGREPVVGDTDEQFCGSFKLYRPDGTLMSHAQCPMADVVNGRKTTVNDAEVLIERPDGSRVTVVVNIRPLQNERGEVTGAINCFYDISERKLAEEILRRNEALFTALVTQAPVGVYVLDSRLRLQQVNPKARPVFNKVHPLIGRDFSEIIRILWPKRVADAVMKQFRHTLRTGALYQAHEFAERRRDTGALEYYEWQIQRVILPAGEQGVVCFFSDITERKKAEHAKHLLDVLTASNAKLKQEIIQRQAVEQSLQKSEQHLSRLLADSQQMQAQLRHHSHQILQAQEEERKRISRELHDEIAQTLTGINVLLAALKKAALHDPQGLANKLSSVQRKVEESVETVHRFARDLRPTVLDDLGLIPALHSFVKAFSIRTGLHIEVTVFAGVEKLDIGKRTILYRVVQEALANVARHAHASQVNIHIQKLGAAARMKIKDNGKSFQVDKLFSAKKNPRLGVLGMRERVEMVGGQFTIESAPAQGTTVHVQIPFGENRAAGGGGNSLPDVIREK